MLPALMQLDPPRVTPVLPADRAPLEIADAIPRQIVRMADGDTLNLEARFVRRTINGRQFVMYGFNGQYPGPLIWVPQDATVIVNFTNNIDWPTAVHWHGVRLENAYDGVPGVTQDPVLPGEMLNLLPPVGAIAGPAVNEHEGDVTLAGCLVADRDTVGGWNGSGLPGRHRDRCRRAAGLQEKDREGDLGADDREPAHPVGRCL